MITHGHVVWELQQFPRYVIKDLMALCLQVTTLGKLFAPICLCHQAV